MRKLLLFIILFISVPANAKDMYEEKAKPIWTTYIMYNAENMVFRSQMRLGDSRLNFMHKMYDLTKHHFFDFTKIDPQRCNFKRLTVNIVSEDDLDDREYFPSEFEYSDEDGVVLGRYFRKSSMLYIVPPYLEMYYWRKVFAHELVHYFNYQCGKVFKNDNLEHKYMKKFMMAKRNWFY